MINIVAIDKQGNREEIDDLYWFEENHVHDFKGDGYYSQYKFELFVNGEMVYPPKIKDKREIPLVIEAEALNEWTKGKSD